MLEQIHPQLLGEVLPAPEPVDAAGGLVSGDGKQDQQLINDLFEVIEGLVRPGQLYLVHGQITVGPGLLCLTVVTHRLSPQELRRPLCAIARRHTSSKLVRQDLSIAEQIKGIQRLSCMPYRDA